MKRILFICRNLYPCNIGGVEIFNYFLIKTLTDTFHVSVITSCKRHNCGNVTVFPVRRKFFWKWDLRLYNRYFLKKIKKVILTSEPPVDLVHIPFTSNSQYLCRLFLDLHDNHGVRYAVTVHGGKIVPWQQPELAKSFFEKAEQVIAVSELIKDEYERRGIKNVINIMPLIPFTKSDRSLKECFDYFGIPEDCKVILALGSIKPLKGSKILLDAFLSLPLDYVKQHKLMLLFVGDGIQRVELEEKSAGSDRSEWIKFTGNIPFEQTACAYEIARIYCIPSWFEGTSKSLAGALFHGNLIIGSNVKGINNVIKHNENGILIEKDDSTGLAAEIRNILSGVYDVDRLKNNAVKTYHEKYSFDITLKQYRSIYQNILRKVQVN